MFRFRKEFAEPELARINQSINLEHALDSSPVAFEDPKPRKLAKGLQPSPNGAS